jgi:hypothetical protein
VVIPVLPLERPGRVTAALIEGHRRYLRQVLLLDP